MVDSASGWASAGRARCCDAWAIRTMGCPGRLIGGTNGKGSAQAMVASVLREAGYSVGQTPKPHLVSYRERIVVDGRQISDQTTLCDLVDEVLRARDARRATSRAADRVRDDHRSRIHLVPTRGASMWRWSRWAWADDWTRRTSGRAG